MASPDVAGRDFEDTVGMSGSLLSQGGRRENRRGIDGFGEDVRPDGLQVHEPGARDASASPLRYRADRYLAELGNPEAAAELVNDVVRVHGRSVEH